MGNLNPVDVTAMIAAIGALVAVIATKGIDAYVRWRDCAMKERRLKFDIEQQERDRDRAEELFETKQLDLGTKFVMRKQDKRITQLEQELDTIRANLVHCVEEHAQARVRIEYLEQEIRTRAANPSIKENKDV